MKESDKSAIRSTVARIQELLDTEYPKVLSASEIAKALSVPLDTVVTILKNCRTYDILETVDGKYYIPKPRW